MTRVVLMSLIICVAIVAFLLAVMLMMGKVGPKCCGTSGKALFICFLSYLFLICWYSGDEYQIEQILKSKFSPFIDGLN